MNTHADPFEPIWAAGFMSGTSIDAVDAAMILTDGERVLDFGPAAERRYDVEERRIIQAAVQAARDWAWRGPEPSRAFAEAEAVLTKMHVEAFESLVGDWRGAPPQVAGVHGQTVLHRRPKAEARGATRQILDATALAAGVGLPIVFDFRTDDVAAGGEGAPLAPAYHAALMDRLGGEPAAVLNLGGVGNITFRGQDRTLVAFDTGPANGPIDEWIEAHGRGAFDKDGALAAVGRVNHGLLAQILDHPYFDETPPKSLDRYDFDANLMRGLGLEDGAATLTALAAHAVARGFEHLPGVPRRLVVCGGGRRNPELMRALKVAAPCDVLSAEDVGWRGDSIEAEAFALLAVRRLRGLPISWPTTTDVPHPMTGGRVTAP